MGEGSGRGDGSFRQVKDGLMSLFVPRADMPPIRPPAPAPGSRADRPLGQGVTFLD